MQLTVDGNTKFAIEPAPDDVVALVAAVSDALRSGGRSIVRVQIDGRDVYPDQLRHYAGKSSSGYSAIEIQSQDTKALVNECLRELGEATPDLAQLCRELAAVFQSDSPSEGYDPFTKLAEIWAFVKEREMLCVSALNLQPAELAVEGVPFERFTDELNRFLKEAEQALAKNDTVLLGDLLEYELAPRAEQEPKIVALLQQHAGPVAQAR